MKRLAYVCTMPLLLMFAIATLSACSSDYEEERIMELVTKSLYGDGMRFYFRIVVNGEVRILDGTRAWIRLDPISSFHDPFYTDLIFVHNEAEANALNLPDNIIVAWPKDAEWTQGLIAGMHWMANRTENEIRRGWGEQLLRPVVTLEEFGLSYPIMIEDLVDNWKKVNALWTTFTRDERAFIQSAAPRGGPRIPEPDSPPTGGDDE